MDDIIEMILEDHKPLKRLIKVMKDSDLTIEERAQAFSEFAPLLVSHAKPEEDSLYVFMKKDDDLRGEALEGDIEHQLADQLCEEIKRTKDPETMGAKIKVLAELVEHHIEEEEEDLLPDFRDNSDLEERVSLGKRFVELKTQMLEKGGEDSPSEKTLQ
ncbi:hemerythrin domain-containing protein [Bdellovibrio sp. HCB209]|uniref:hemerythrin domain-containing protein n=1 Tax=Bdellovibrio sp. HCB209 TaxID=3394354 RepID=UPI0039B62654